LAWSHTLAWSEAMVLSAGGEEVSEEPIPTPDGCVAVVTEELCLDADVDVRPFVRLGHVRTRCVSGPFVEGNDWFAGGARKSAPDKAPSDGERAVDCRFSVRQVLCVTVPLIFDANVEAVVAGVRCGTPKAGSCPP